MERKNRSTVTMWEDWNLTGSFSRIPVTFQRQTKKWSKQSGKVESFREIHKNCINALNWDGQHRKESISLLLGQITESPGGRKNKNKRSRFVFLFSCFFSDDKRFCVLRKWRSWEENNTYHVHDRENVGFNVFVAVEFGHLLVGYDQSFDVALQADGSLADGVLTSFLRLRLAFLPLFSLAKCQFHGLCSTKTVKAQILCVCIQCEVQWFRCKIVKPKRIKMDNKVRCIEN